MVNEYSSIVEMIPSIPKCVGSMYYVQIAVVGAVVVAAADFVVFVFDAVVGDVVDWK